jgi:hypothetical protein
VTAAPISGRVVDEQGRPVVGAKVQLAEKGSPEGSRSAATDENGDFMVYMMHAPMSVPLRMEVSKEGYRTHWEEFDGSGNQEHNVTLKRDRKE